MRIIDLLHKYGNWIKGESLEQAKFACWLENNGYIFTSIPNSTFTKSIKQKIVNKMLGLNKGFPDMVVVLKRGSLCFVELKKAKGPRGGLSGSRIGEEQERWVSALDSISNVAARFCHGAEEAKAFVMEMEEK